MKKLLVYLKKYKQHVIWGPITKLLEAVLELFTPLITAQIIDVGVKNGDTGYILRMGGLMIVLAIVGLGLAVICQYLASVASQGYGTELRSKLFSHINSLSQKEIDDFGTPSLVTRITNDVNQLQLTVAMTIRLVLRAPILAIGACIMAFSIDWQLSLIFFAALPIIALVLYLVISRSVPYFKKIQKVLDKISLISRENLSGVRVIRSFSNQSKEIERFEETTDTFTKFNIIAGKISSLMGPLNMLIMNAAIILIIWIGGDKVFGGVLQQGEIIALINYVSIVLMALFVVAHLVMIYTKAAASAARVSEILDIKATVHENATDETLDINAPLVDIKNVSFQYSETGDYALENINLTINKGETIGIIGGTGSGKSTLINLILRFFNVTKGEILINGKNVQHFAFNELRKKIGLVPQKAVLFRGTIRDNMKWGNENATDEEIMSAIKLAQGFDFVSNLKDGLDHLIEQNGRNLSGGQRQRLTIARALVRKPELLFLDDSASALDYATDAALRKSLKSLASDMTVIIISQRANAIKHADKILVLDDGLAVGLGTHQELLNTCEIYQEICSSQFSASELKEGK